jgi:hypothetical protein
MAPRQRASPDPQPPLTPLSPPTASPRIAAAPRRSTEQLPGHAATSPLRPAHCDRPTATWTPRSSPTLTTWTCSPWTGHREREFQDAFVARFSHFLTGLGAGFAVGGRRYQLPSATRTTSWTCCSSTSAFAGRSSSSSKLAGQNPLASPSSASPPSSTTCSADQVADKAARSAARRRTSRRPGTGPRTTRRCRTAAAVAGLEVPAVDIDLVLAGGAARALGYQAASGRPCWSVPRSFLAI